MHKNLEKKNVLVLGVGGNVGVGILKSLGSSRLNINLIGACVTSYAAGAAFCDDFILSPFVSDDCFLIWLKNLVLDKNIKAVLSGVEEINDFLAGINSDDLGDCKILVPDENYLRIFGDKFSTIEWMKSNKIRAPKTLDLSLVFDFSQVVQALSLPFILKPKFGKGSNGVFVVENEDQFYKISWDNNYIAQELIGDEGGEYTCGVYKSIYGYEKIIILHRFLRAGSTCRAEVVNSDVILNYCKQISSALNLANPFNIQLRLSKNGLPYCFEINMRLSGTTSIRHGFGFRDCEAWVAENIFNINYSDDFLVKNGVAIRFEEEVYFNSDGSLGLI